MRGRIRQRSARSRGMTYDLPRDATGNRERKSLAIRGIKAQAQRKLREVLSIVDRGGNPDPGVILLAAWLDRWMEQRVVPNLRQGTKERYQEMIYRYIVPALGHIDIAQLGPAHIQALEAELSKRLSHKTVNQVHIVLSGAMKHALRLELISRNPVALVSPPTVRRREIIPPDVSVVRDALALARDEGDYLYQAMHLLAYTGIRRGEALGLLWKNVDLERGFVRIESSLVRSRERGLMLEPPKTAAGRRVVDLDGVTVEVLAAHRRRPAPDPEVRPQYRDLGIVFADEDGDWIHPERLSRAVKRVGKRVGREDMTVRSLRHFHASLMLQQGQNIVVVSKRLGHSTVSMTADIYSHALPGWQKEAAEAFARGMERE